MDSYGEMNTSQSGPTECANLTPCLENRDATQPVGKILVVEDEQALLFAVSRMIEKTGYSVLQAADGRVAVELLRLNANSVTLVLLDATLPGLSSREVLQEARRIQPRIAVILTSALSQKEVESSFYGFDVKHFIRKPYRLAALIQLLQQVLPAA